MKVEPDEREQAHQDMQKVLLRYFVDILIN